jgi:hypothetical protein
VIYERSSSNPLAQALVKEIRAFLEKQRAEGASQGIRLGASTVKDCLEVIEADVRFYLSTNKNSTDYLAFISRNHPEAALQGPQEGLIVAP